MVTHIETYYLVDYENVGSDGLSGLDKLDKSAHIHLFYTENAKRIKLDIFESHGEAEFVTHKVPVGKQSADMHLVSFLGYIIGINKGMDCSYVIVSKDTDFDNIIKYWKENTKVKVQRSQKIKQATVKQAAPTKQPTVTKAGSSKVTKKVNKADKTKLNQEIQQALSKARCYDNKVISDVAQIVGSHYGKESLLVDVHNSLRAKYTDYLEVYETIKGVVSRYVPTANIKTGHDKTALNVEIQQILSKAGMETEVINNVASIIVKNMGAKNSRQQIYRNIVAKYGQKKGLDIYTRIKKHIP